MSEVHARLGTLATGAPARIARGISATSSTTALRCHTEAFAGHRRLSDTASQAGGP